MNNVRNDGPIHFYPTNDRDASLSNVVEYCVQIGERQPLTRSQASMLVVSGEVLLNGQVSKKLGDDVPQGAWQITIRGRNHHVMIHPAIVE